MTNDVFEFYDEFADYQLGYLLNPNRRLQAIKKRLRPVLTERRPAKALDAGCGIGVMTDWLARSVPGVIGVDISSRSIRIASELYRRPEFAVCDLPSEPLPAGPFDLVTLFDVLEHFEPDAREAVFRRIGEVASQDAVIAVNTPSRLFALALPSEKRQVIDEAVGVDEIVRLASGLGMEPLSVERYGVASPNQYVLCTFSRTYETAGSLGPRRAEMVRDCVVGLANRTRRRRRLERLRGLH